MSDSLFPDVDARPSGGRARRRAARATKRPTGPRSSCSRVISRRCCRPATRPGWSGGLSRGWTCRRSTRRSARAKGGPAGRRSIRRFWSRSGSTRRWMAWAARARSIGSATRHDAYRWLRGGVSVNYHTLSDFRVAHQAALDDLLTQSIAALLHRGIVTLARVAQDGTRVRGSAGAGSFRRGETLRRVCGRRGSKSSGRSGKPTRR